jgi:predicted secreted protein
MAKGAGRNALLKKAGTTIGGVQVTSMKMDATFIDVTDNDSDGVVEYLAGDVATRQLTLEVSGLHKDTDLHALAFVSTASLRLTDLTFVFEGAGASLDILTANWMMSNYTYSGNHDGPVEFSATFVSDGGWALA